MAKSQSGTCNVSLGSHDARGWLTSGYGLLIVTWLLVQVVRDVWVLM